jgi:hypothetical protein
MDRKLSRPKNEDIGEPLREKRVAVMMSQEDYDKLKFASQKMGLGVSTYMRVKALEAASGG